MKYTTFCAANSGDGFISFFKETLDENSKNVYYIKGGPGCGKSTLLKQIATRATNAEMILCSGDPSSLDGVILPDLNCVIIDATNPHSFEPQYPGVGGNIIDLGEGWIPQKLNRDKIIRLTNEKSKIYKDCYQILSGAKKIHTGVYRQLNDHIIHPKINSLIEKILKQNALWNKTENQWNIDQRFISSISPEGPITLTDGFERLGKNSIILEDRWMISSVILEKISKKLFENRINQIIGYHPLLGKKAIQHLIIPEADLSIISNDPIFHPEIPETRIIKRVYTHSLIEKEFIDQNKNKLSFVKKIEKELIDIACNKLSDAKNIHMEIEAEYIKGTDFNATRILRENLINNIFSLT